MRRIALYSQDAHGLGRLRRNVAIARALGADGRSILLISGAGEAALVDLPEGAAIVWLEFESEGAYGYDSRPARVWVDLPAS